MSSDFATDTLALVQAMARRMPLPRVRALHLPPKPVPTAAMAAGNEQSNGRGDAGAEATRGEFAALELDDGSLGLSYMLLDDTWAGLHAQGQRLVQPGQDTLQLAQGLASDELLKRTVGFAAVNALTRCLFDRAGFVPPASSDSIGHLDPQPGELIGMVGHFTPLIGRILERGAMLLIVELRADLVGERPGVRVTLDASELAHCRKVLATGTLLLNNTLDSLLLQCRQASHLALIGPSVGGPPDPLFARGVTLLGGSWVLDTPAFLQALRQGERPGASTRKFALTQADYPGWAALLARC